MKRSHGWLPDLPDARDYCYASHPEMLTAAPLPPSVDLKPLQSPVVNQGDLGSCTGNAIAGALEFLELQEIHANVPPGPQAPEEFGSSFAPISRLFIYYNERAIEGTTGYDSGAQIRDGIKAVRNWGICREMIWPYSHQNAFIKPADQAYQEAASHKILSGYRIENSYKEMKQCLASGFPFVFGITVYPSFMSGEVERTGMVPMPNPSERPEGGHALLCVGYDDSKSRFIVKNSWGPHWGDSGYCYLAYSYLGDSNLCADLWTLRR